MEATTLWDAFQKHGDETARDQLLSQHLPLVHHVARQVLRTLSVQVELDDLVSAGSVGLINAVESFDPSRGLAFSTYAAPRIRGAILDDLRKNDHVPRSIRRKQRQIAAAEQRLSGSLDRKPDDRETAHQLGIDIDTLWRWRADTEEAVQVSLDQPLSTGNGRTAVPGELLEGGSGAEIESHVTHTFRFLKQIPWTKPLRRVPENTMKFVVGVMLTSFGMFWGAEGAGARWPHSDGARAIRRNRSSDRKFGRESHAQIDRVARDGWISELLSATLLGLLDVGRDPARGTVIPLFGPPDGMSAAAVRFVNRMGFDDRCFTAAIIDLGVGGHLRITGSGSSTAVPPLNRLANVPHWAAPCMRGASTSAVDGAAAAPSRASSCSSVIGVPVRKSIPPPRARKTSSWRQTTPFGSPGVPPV